MRGVLVAGLVSLACQRPPQGTTDLARWSRVAVVTGSRPQSLALLDGVLYVGTRDAELYRLVGWP